MIAAAGASVHLNTRGSAGFRAIDYAGNRNLLEEARTASVRKFVYVSALNAPGISGTEYVRAKEDFAALVAKSGLEYQILRPTGFFSAFADLIPMARKGPLPMFGSGAARTNPIDDEEVAAACVEAIDSTESERAIGGPDVLSRKQITDLVFESMRRRPRYRRVPAWMVGGIGKAAGLFNPRIGDLVEFYRAVAESDEVAPVYGMRRLEDYIRTVARFG